MSSTFTAMAPTLDVVSPPLQPHCQHPNSAVLASWGQGKGGRGEEKVHAMVIGRRLGSGRMRNGSFTPRCLSLCPLALATLAGGKTGVSVHSLSLLDSLSFWFLLGRGCAPLLVPMGWGILECLGEPGEAVSIVG